MPISVLRLRGAAAAAASGQPSETLQDRFRKAYKTRLLRSGCIRRGECTAPAGERLTRCTDSTGACPVPLLFSTWADARGRTHPPAVAWWIRDSGFEIETDLVIFGRRALEHRALIIGTAGAAFAAAFGSRRVDERLLFEGRLLEWAEQTTPPALGHVLLEFATPYDPGLDERGRLRPFSLADVVGNLAHDLAQWDLHDRSADASKRDSDLLADATRDRVRALVGNVEIEGGGIQQVDLGTFRSSSSRRNFQLAGYQGYCVVAGNLPPLLPWLGALALRGAGAHKSYGLGRVRLWFPPTLPPAPEPLRTFVNLSNHPIASWPPGQLDAARAEGLGEPCDWPGGMPDVAADSDTETVVRLARTLVAEVIASGARAAFVATDYALTYALVSELQRAGVRCFSAATRRESLEHRASDGSVEKTSIFRFVRWREYPR